MTDEDEPVDAGTNGEQHETDDNGIPVEAVDEQKDETDIDAEITKLQEMLANLDGEDVAVVGCVVGGKGVFENIEGENVNGFTWRMVNLDLDGFEDVTDVVDTLAKFNDSCDEIKVPMDASGPDLSDFL